MSFEKITTNHVNVNVRKKEFNNVNVKNQIEDWAERTIKRLRDPNPMRLAYYKAWHTIGESRLDGLLAQAETGKNPAAYFFWLIRKENGDES